MVEKNEAWKVNQDENPCWWCRKGDTDAFDTEFDTNLHISCLKDVLEKDPNDPEAKHMKYLLEDDKKEEKLKYTEKPTNGGTQRLYKFKNNYGASVVQSQFSYGGDEGLWELAVIIYDDKDDWSLTYDTPVTNDVMGRLTWDEVEKTLKQIEKLKENGSRSKCGT